jgi:hypothetical protein
MMTDEAKDHILSDTGDDAMRAALASIPAAYFQVAEETADDPTDRTCVLWRLVELYESANEQLRRHADEATAELATLRRARLRLVVSEPTRNEKGA